MKTRQPKWISWAVALVVSGCATTAKVMPGQLPNACTAVVGANLITRPEAEPIRDGTVVWCGGVIRQVGPASSVAVPEGATVLDGAGATVVAGYWNTHLHFTERAFEGAARQPADALAEALEGLTTRWGFVHVVDLGSNPANTRALQARLASGEVRGPVLHRAEGPFIAPGGQPKYVPVPLPELRSPEHARLVAESALDDGADGIKLMTASVVAKPPAPVMSVDVVRAVTQVAHAKGKLVFAHPTNAAGVEAARAGHVDVLAHTAPEDGPWTVAQAQALKDAGMALIPTLSLWRAELAEVPALGERFERAAVAQVKAFHDVGGTLLFGTDSGYRPEHDPATELRLLTQAGLTWREQLAMLTTAPAARFGLKTGQLEPGYAADVVLLEGDPSVDPVALGRVNTSVRAGLVVFTTGRGPRAESAPKP